MVWTAVFHEELEGKFDGLKAIVQDGLLAKMMLLEKFSPEEFGPGLGRPHVDPLNGVKEQILNMITNSSGSRDRARVLRISPTPVIKRSRTLPD